MSRQRIDAIYPVTPSQQGFVLGHLAQPTEGLFVEQALFRLVGPLEPKRLREIWRQLSRRHEILRTAFAWNLSETPRQVVLSDASVDVEVIEPRELSADGQAHELQRTLDRHRSTPFDLNRAPLLRLALQQHSEGEHTLLWTHHHAILDGWSQMRLVGEMLNAYNGEALVSAAIPFGKYATWLSRREFSTHQAFWHDTLRGYPALELLPPLDPLDGGDRFGTRALDLPAEHAIAVAQFARDSDLTLSSVLIASWCWVAATLRGTAEIAVGVTMSGRSPEFTGAENVIGCCVNTVPVRVTMDADRPFGSWVRSVQERVTDASQFSDSSAAQIHGWANLPADRTLVDSVVAIGNYPAPRRDRTRGSNEIALERSLQAFGGRTLQPLVLVVTIFDGMTIRLVNDRTRISDRTAGAAFDAFVSALGRIDVTAESRPLSDVLPSRPLPLEMQQLAPTEGQVAIAESGTIEAVVARAFAELLRLETVDVNGNFIALGGHSMLGIELLRKLRSAFAVDLTLQDLFSTSTPAGIAKRVATLLGSTPARMEEMPAIRHDPADAGRPFPLTDIQQAYWAGRQGGFELGGVDSHTYLEIDVPNLDIERFEAVWRRLIDRHPMLRAVITSDGCQRVLDSVEPYAIAVTDLRGLTSDALAELRNRLSRSHRRVTEWPLFTIEAARLSAGITRLFFSFDLLIGDAESWRILYHELLTLYRDPSATLEPLEVTFQDYVGALPALRNGDTYRRAREYWNSRLDVLPLPPEFPLLPRHQHLGQVEFRRRQLTLGLAEAREVRRRATELGVTPSVLLLGVFSEIVGRFTNSTEFLINLTIFNRLPLHPQIDQIVGDFTSLLLVAVSVEGGTLPERIRRLQRQMWIDLDHRLYGGLDVLREIRKRKECALDALAPVVFTSTLDAGKADRSREPLPGQIAYAIGQTPQVVFDYQVFEVDGTLSINWDTVDELFPPGYLDQMFDAHAVALRSILVDAGPFPESLRPPTRAPALTTAPLGGDQLLHQPFIARALAQPESVAIAAADRRMTYGETLSFAIGLANRLRELERESSPVAIVMTKGWEQIVGALGTLLSGRPFVPIDASWPSERVISLLEKTRISVVVSQSEVLRRLKLPDGVQRIVVDELKPPVEPLTEPPPNATACDATAYVVFTSGSTGSPKGVVIQHRAALNTILDVNRRFDVGPNDRILSLSSLSFDLSIYDVFGVLAAGGTVVVPRQDELRDPACWARLVAEERVTLWNSVPVSMDLLVNAAAALASNPLRSLRLCLLSGDWIPLSLPSTIRTHAPEARTISLGGATEASIWSILYEIDGVDPAWSSIPYGRSMTGQCVEVLGLNLEPCPPWVCGEIFISGHGVALGYWDEPDLSAKSFVWDSRTERRLYRTGDWGRLRADGTIELFGRRDEQVKVNGYRVELREIEAALASASGVEMAAVIATGDRFNRRLAGFVTGRTTSTELRNELCTRLPEYLVPTSIEVLEELPLSAVGKVDRSALVRRAEGRRQLPSSPSESAIDPALRAVVAATLGSDPQPDANLLELGMTSVEVIRLINAIEHQIGKRPSIGDFYRSPTLRGLGKALEVQPSAKSRESVRGRNDCRPGKTPWDGWKILTDPIEREGFRRARPVFPAPLELPVIQSREPVDERRYGRRRSSREFGSGRLRLATFARALECLRAAPSADRPRFLYPSAGGLYGVDVYVHVRPGRIDQLAPGLHYYHPLAHDLVPIVSDIELDVNLHQGHVNGPLAESAAFTIFLVTDPAQSAPLYGADAERLGLLNAGYMGQLLCESASAVGIAICPLSGYDFDDIRWLFPNGERAVLLHLLAGGPPREENESATPRGAGYSSTAATGAPPRCVIASRTAPLSPGQERLLQSEYVQSDGTWPSDGEVTRLRPMDTAAVVVDGALDVHALDRALNTLVGRQSALRTTLRFPRGAPPVQIVSPLRKLSLKITDLTSLDAPIDVSRLVAERSQRRISPVADDLFDAELVRVDRMKHLLLLQIHHLISDGWSIGVLYRELSEIYNALVERREVRLPPLHRDFADICVRMGAERHSPRLQAQLRYWQDELRDPAPQLRFFGRTQRADSDETQVDDEPVAISSALVAALRKAGQAAPIRGGIAGPFLAALAIVLHTQTGTTEIGIGNMIAARTNVDTEHLVGYFVNTVPIRVSVDLDLPLTDLIAQVNDKVASAMENQDAPIQDVAGQLQGGVERHHGSVPYQVTVALNSMRRHSLTLAGTLCTDAFRSPEGDVAGYRSAPTRMVLRWVLDEGAEGLRGSVTYNRDIFDKAEIRACIEDLTIALTAVARSAGTVGSLLVELEGANGEQPGPDA